MIDYFYYYNNSRSVRLQFEISVYVSDASIVAVGASIDELLRASNVFSNPNTGIYIMPNYKFPAKGIVAGFEMFVTKVGFLRLQVIMHQIFL